MKKFLLICLTLLVSFNARADEWFGQDKAKHAAVSFALGVGAQTILPEDKPLAAFGLAMMPGIAKELSDSRAGGSGWSNKDLVADAVGAALGVYVTRQVQIRFGRRSVTVAGTF